MSITQALRNKNLKSILLESWSVSWPMTLIMFFIFLIGLTDVYVAGRFGKEAQAAYGLVFQIYFIFTIIASALTVGSVSLLSRLFTAKRRREFDEAFGTTILITFFCGLASGVLAFFCAGALIQSLAIPAALKGIAVPIMKTYAVGLLFNYMLLATNGILRATNMVRKSLGTMSVVCVANVFFDLFLPSHTSLGFKGIAAATVISTVLGCAINFVHIRQFVFFTLKFSRAAARRIAGISWPSGVLQVLWQLGTAALFLIFSGLPAHGIEVMAAFTNGLRIESVIFLPAFAFNMSCAVVVGNLIGKQQQEDAYHGGILTACVGVGIVSVLTVIVMLNARFIASFLSDNPVVINECVKYIYISLISEPFMAWGVILSGGLNGAGDTKSVMCIIALSMWLVRIPLSYISVVFLHGEVEYVWWSMNVSILLQTILISRRYFKKQWIVHADIRNLCYN